MPGKMLSFMTMAALMASVTAAPHPECEPCAEVTGENLEALANTGKYLCCDLTCLETPVAGCGMFGLPLVCKACYNGDGTPEFDADPEEGSGDAPTPTPGTTSSSTTGSGAPGEPTAGSTGDESMSFNFGGGSTGDESMSFDFGGGSTGDESISFDFECTACDDADMILTNEDWQVLQDDDYELVCDPSCVEGVDGCGAFGLETECRAVPLADLFPVGGSDGEGGGETQETAGPTASPVASTSSDAEGVGETVETAGPTPAPFATGSGDGEGGGETEVEEGEGSGSGGGGDAGECSEEQIATCADISDAQREALAAYDNGEKIVVCDLTCQDDVANPSDVSHCNYFGLAQYCRGCGDCSECVPCP